MVQGCVNGYGERTGNADLLVVAGNLQLKMKKKCFPGHDDGGACLTKITRVASAVASACGQPLDPKQAYVGSNAFAHKGGLHVAALAKMPSSYNHVVPGLVGNKQRAVVSELSGRGNIVAAARDSGREVSPETATKVLAQIKDMERRGFVLEDAGATVEILFNRADPMYRAPFNVVEFTCHLSNNSFSGGGGFGAGELDEGEVDVNSTANTNPSPVQALAGYKKGSVAVNQVVVKVDLFAYDDNDAESAAPVAMKTTLCVSEGNGPVNALDNALRKALDPLYPQLEDMKLTDYKVRILSPGGGTGAITRVMIESVDGKGQRWSTIGVSANVIDASYNALNDAITYKLFRDGAVA